MRRITIRQWLLLLLRTLIIIFLVLAFSRPALHGTLGSLQSKASSSIVIILDNTPSMQRQNTRGSFILQAREQARQIISAMKENDDGAVLRLSDIPFPTIETLTRDKQKLTTVVQGTEPASIHRTVDDALITAGKILNKSPNINKEIYIVTDGQLTTLTGGKKRTNQQQSDNLSVSKVFYTMVEDQSFDNVAIEKIEIPPSILIPGKQISIDAVIKNYGKTGITNHLVGLTFGKKRISQRNITLEAGETTTVEFSVTPDHSGFVSGFVETEDDNFNADNKRYFSFYIPEQIRALVVSSAEKYSQYIATAFSAAAGDQTRTPIAVTVTSPSLLTSNLIASNDVLIFSGITQVPESYRRLLQESFTSGKGMLFFPSDDTLHAQYEYLKQLGIRGLNVFRSQNRVPSTIEKIDFDFPVFRGMFDAQIKKGSGVESPDVLISLVIDRTPALQSIISLSNGNPFFWEYKFQRGKLLGFSIPAIPGWSDLPYKGLFVTLLYQSTLYLAAQINIRSAEAECIAGESPSFSPSLFRTSKTMNLENLTAYDPNNRPLTISLQKKSGVSEPRNKNISMEGIDFPGLYSVQSGNDTLAVFPANINAAESDGTIAHSGQFTALLASFGVPENSVTALPAGGAVEKTILQSRFGVELWKYFLVFALIFALIEMIVAREKKEL